MPIEFAAAYRFGHSMVRPSYRANFTPGTSDSANPAANPFFGLVFDVTLPGFSGPINSRPRRPARWLPRPSPLHRLADVLRPRRQAGQNNKKIDTKISSVLFTLPVPATAPHTQPSPTVLPQRNLLRQLTWGLPSGQQVVKAMHVSPLKPGDQGGIMDVYLPFGANAPPWFYLLAEAKAASGGLTLGPIGGRIVTETLLGLLRADPSSYLSVQPGWTPSLGPTSLWDPTPGSRCGVPLSLHE